MKLKREMRKLGLLLLCLSFIIPSAFSWCFAGVGNTCGSQATEEHGFFGSIFNLDKPKQDSSFSAFGWKPFDDGLFDTNDRSASLKNSVSDVEGDSTDITDDSGSSYKIKTVKRSTKTSTKTGELAPALFYNVDVTNAEFNCINCPVKNGQVVQSAGFTYQLDIDLINDGNIETTNPISLKIEITSPEGTEIIEFGRNALTLPAGNFELSIPIESFGVENGQIKPQYILTDENIDIPIDVYISVGNDEGVPEPRIQLITKTKRVCSGSGEDRSCETKVSYEEKESCPDGSEYRGSKSCQLESDNSNDVLEKTFNIQKISPEVLGESQFGFFSG